MAEVEDDSKGRQAATMKTEGAPSPPTKDAELTHRLWEACVDADWASVDALCDEYTKTKHKYGEDHDNVVHWSDAALSAVIESLSAENRLNANPLMAAVLMAAVDVAAAHRSFSLFSDAVAQDLVDAENTQRHVNVGTGGFPTLDDPATVADFCPYLKMRTYGENHPAIDDAHRRARRKAIAKLCRANPLWILLPLAPRGGLPRSPHDESAADAAGFDDDLPRGTTPLHVAVRSRNVALTRLLVKHCPKAAEVADADGCLPLHYAVRPSDETSVLRRAVLTYQRSLGGGADDAPAEAGPNEVHAGINLYYHGKVVFKAARESGELARCRVRRLRRSHGMRERKARVLGSSLARSQGLRLGNADGSGGTKGEGEKGGDPTDLRKEECRNQSDGSKNNSEKIKGASKASPYMYETPSSLVRAMMRLGTVEEDSADLVQSEWGIARDNESGNGEEDSATNGATEETRRSALAAEYPIVVDCMRTVSRGAGRPTRPWRTERHRMDIVRLLTTVHPQGMLYQCDDGGDTPLILACQTLLGDDGEEEDFGGFPDPEGDPDDDGAVPDDGAPGVGGDDPPVPDDAGEDDAEYEADLPPRAAVEPVAEAVDGAQEQRLDDGAAANINGDGGENGQQQQQPVPNNEGEVDPLEAVLFMIANNGSSAMGIPDDDGDTALHAATRIGSSPRLVRRLLDAMPALASTPAEDGSTPLHLACRRACHLAPEGNGGMGTYDAAEIRLLADAAGSGALTAADDEGRTPFHVACRYRASPSVLAELADADGGSESLLVRDTEGHAPLGVYCRHATDYHGLRVLVDRCPEAAAAAGDGRRLPLHRVLATFNLAVNVDCLRLIGNAYPRGLDSADARGMTPLALLCESYRGPLNVDIPKLRSGRTTLERCLSKKIWLMARYLILAARTNRMWKARTNAGGNGAAEPQRELILHATLREPSSSVEIVQLATVVHADQLGQTDANGELPLHLCCRRKQSGSTTDGTSEDEETATGDSLYDEGRAVFHRVNDGVAINEEPLTLDGSQPNRDARRRHNPCRDYLLILYHILLSDPAAAGRPNDDGKYPLNLLVDGGSSWRAGGVDRVLKAHPPALFSYELSNALFAMALARAADHPPCATPERLREEQASCIGATFQLLRGKPTALEGANTVPGKGSGKCRKSKRLAAMEGANTVRGKGSGKGRKSKRARTK